MRHLATDYKGWDKFWAKREYALSPRQLIPFYNNFACMMGIFDKCGVASEWYRDANHGQSVLEVGAGRGTMSKLFHQKRFNVFCTDIENRLKCTQDICTFVKNDILESRPFAEEQFDITFTYGLLEHFNYANRLTIMERCLDMTKQGGISMHYVVPKKWTNIREDRSVYRDPCKDLMRYYNTLLRMGTFQEHGIRYVFPVWGNDWECSRFRCKGFIIWVHRFTEFDLWVHRNIL
jgi:hypothetical protein